MRDFHKSRTRGHRNVVAKAERFKVSFTNHQGERKTEEFDSAHLATFRFHELKAKFPDGNVKKTKLS
jgi:hypothetical protein